MKKKSSSIVSAFICAITLAAPAGAEAPAGYYSSLEGKSGVELIKAVKAVGFRNHKTISYGSGTWTAFHKTDVRIVNGKECWWDMYSSNNVGVTNSVPSTMNIEHSVANSWWDGTKNDAYKDIVHLNPSDKDANSRKGNYPLAEVGKVTWDNGVTFVGKPVSGQGGGSSMVYEPHDDYKGDFARTYMYMFVIYRDMQWGTRFTWMYDTSSELMFRPWAYELLLKWHAADPVSDKERDRNDGIAATQGNRNPFIDLPDLADYIWGAKKGMPYSIDGSNTPDPGPVDPEEPDVPGPVEPEDPDLPDNPGVEAGKYLLVASQNDIRAGESYLIVGSASDVAMSTELNNKKNGYFMPTAKLSVKDGVIEEVPADVAEITLEPTEGGYALRMNDLSGTSKGYIFCSSVKNLDLTDHITTPGVKASVTWTAQGVKVVYGPTAGTGAGALYYNKNAPRFTTYTSEQEHLHFYRKIRESSGVAETETIDDSILVEVWGNTICVPEGARIFDLNGREVSGENVARGIYIVTKPSFRKAVKVMVK